MSRLVHSRLFHFLILLALLLGATYYSSSDHVLRRRLQYTVFDFFNNLHQRPPTQDVVIVDIDEESLRRMGQWPWPRSVVADLTMRLKEMGAASVTFDMVFSEPDRTSPALIADRLPDTDEMAEAKEVISTLPDNDGIFADSIAAAGNVVTGFVPADAHMQLRTPSVKKDVVFLPPAKAAAIRDDFLMHTASRGNIATNLPLLDQAAAGSGHFMADTDVDGIIRRAQLYIRYNQDENSAGQLFPMLGLEALRVAINPKIENQIIMKKESEQKPLDTRYMLRVAQKYAVPIESDSRFWIYYRDIGEDEYIPAYKIMADTADADVRTQIDGKIVFVGTSAIGLKDIRSTPLDLFIPGVEVHVNIVEQIIQGKFLTRPDLVVGAESIAIFIGGLLIIILAPFLNALLLGLFSLTAISGGFALSWHAYTAWGLLLDPVYPGLAIIVIFLVSTLLSYVRTEADRRRVKNAFGYYISPDFMEELTKNPEKLALGGETRDLTVMFTDIRNFTSISERMSPAALIQLMNDFLTPMSDLVMQNRGTIDKFMGDAMMAFWNAPLDDPDHARHACMAALKMNQALLPINQQLKKEAEAQGLEPLVLQAGIGLNTGPTSVGNMGSRQRFAYSALGDTVNLASRLEGQTKGYGVNILIGPKTYEAVQDMAVLELDLLRVKGKLEPVKVYTLLGTADMAGAEEFRMWKQAHDRMLQAYRQGDFVIAQGIIDDCRRLSAGVLATYYDVYSQRITELTKNHPGDGWDGVFVATSK